LESQYLTQLILIRNQIHTFFLNSDQRCDIWCLEIYVIIHFVFLKRGIGIGSCFSAGETPPLVVWVNQIHSLFRAERK
jgi:hypothetical protein